MAELPLGRAVTEAGRAAEEVARRSAAAGRAVPAPLTAEQYVAKVTQSAAFRKLGLDYVHSRNTPIDASMMRAILAMPGVKEDPSRFVKDVLLESPLYFEPGREAKLEVVVALAKKGDRALAERFSREFAGMDNDRLLMFAYDEVAAGHAAPSYWSMLNNTMRALSDGFGQPAASAPPSALIARHPHLQALQAAGWDVRAVLQQRPDLARALTDPAFELRGDVQLAGTYFDLPADAVKSMAEDAALLGYRSLSVAENLRPQFERALRGSRVSVETGA